MDHLGKVTAFITRPGPAGEELLLFQHPYAGVQIPAGTVEPGETPEQAVLREAWEETGLEGLQILRSLGWQDEPCPDGFCVVGEKTKVYARPDATSFGWAELRSGIQVRQLRAEGEFIQVTYEEWDQAPDPTYLTYQITGWVPGSTLCQVKRRHFFRLTSSQAGAAPASWLRRSDQHEFRLFWARRDALPAIIPPQDGWLGFLKAGRA
jgi:8-oxo-dGTP pyrophosphatase MutT (NUDIX family)